MNFPQLFTRYLSVMCVFQMKFVFYNNNDPNIITFSGWTVPKIKMASNANIKDGIGSFVERHWPGLKTNSPIDLEFGIEDIIYYLGPSINSISRNGMDELCNMRAKIGTTTSVHTINRVGIQLFLRKADRKDEEKNDDDNFKMFDTASDPLIDRVYKNRIKVSGAKKQRPYEWL